MPTCSVNFCNQPPWILSSHHFNRRPQPIEIQGVQHHHRSLFERLDAVADPELRAGLFHDYMDVHFQLHQWRNQSTPGSRKSLKNSYLRFLRGWMFDSNSGEGAVLKGWVESRFGIAPTFHGQPISDHQSGAYYAYLVDRMNSSARTSSIQSQLDLLFSFAQYEMARRFPGQRHFELYRGIYDFEEHPILEKYDRRRYLIRLNNLNSFTSDFERAWEFGTRVLAVSVPYCKILFFSGLFPSPLLRGEEEYLVIGGDYEVNVLTGG
jgi:NAD+--dinitrogen-reductase ADP-D-ribosyltransferase